ncbi:MAG TPA: hypothetical protein VK705_12040 [Ferruginibacter sp.]|jgi:hypothetical protein|nr:hypothetical protein [Ferruginibacter sp.]
MKKLQYIKIAEFAGRGGPNKPTVSRGDRYPPTPTTMGRYVIASIDWFSSKRYHYWSAVRWGTPMRVINGVVQINPAGNWIDLSKFNNDRNGMSESEIKEDIENYCSQLYSSATTTKVPGTVPNKWVLDDFGHTTIQYFTDLNGNFELDKNEYTVGDMVHTTPVNEISTTLEKPFDLKESHGCIHVRPADIDTMIKSGFVKKGQVIEVHSYTELTYPLTFERTFGREPYEFHFFPGCEIQAPGSTTGRNKGAVIIYAVHQL